MKIKFYLQAVPNFVGKLRVLEYYEFVGGGAVYDVNGRARPVFDMRGLVDDNIKNLHKADYEEFQEKLAPQWDALAEQARANPGIPV